MSKRAKANQGASGFAYSPKGVALSRAGHDYSDRCDCRNCRRKRRKAGPTGWQPSGTHAA